MTAYRPAVETLHGTRFTREQRLSALAVVGGGSTPESGGDGFVDLLCCLVSSGAIEPDALKRWGVDPERAQKCFERLCRARATPDRG